MMMLLSGSYTPHNLSRTSDGDTGETDLINTTVMIKVLKPMRFCTIQVTSELFYFCIAQGLSIY